MIKIPFSPRPPCATISWPPSGLCSSRICHRLHMIVKENFRCRVFQENIKWVFSFGKCHIVFSKESRNAHSSCVNCSETRKNEERMGSMSSQKALYFTSFTSRSSQHMMISQQPARSFYPHTLNLGFSAYESYVSSLTPCVSAIALTRDAFDDLIGSLVLILHCDKIDIRD